MREFFDGENRTSASLPHMPFTFTKSKEHDRPVLVLKR